MNDSTEQLSLNAEDLYREESFTDQKVGTIRRLTPVDTDGNDDSSRSAQFFGHTQVLTPAGALPINFELEQATNLGEAAAAFAEAAEKALEKTMQELQELRRQQSSSIMVPGQGGGGGMPGGGMGGSGIQMP